MNRRHALASLAAAGAAATAPRLSAGEVKDDVEVVRRALDLHPGLFPLRHAGAGGRAPRAPAR